MSTYVLVAVGTEGMQISRQWFDVINTQTSTNEANILRRRLNTWAENNSHICDPDDPERDYSWVLVTNTELLRRLNSLEHQAALIRSALWGSL
jgi:hypothetical protein